MRQYISSDWFFRFRLEGERCSGVGGHLVSHKYSYIVLLDIMDIQTQIQLHCTPRYIGYSVTNTATLYSQIYRIFCHKYSFIVILDIQDIQTQIQLLCIHRYIGYLDTNTATFILLDIKDIESQIQLNSNLMYIYRIFSYKNGYIVLLDIQDIQSQIKLHSNPRYIGYLVTNTATF